MHRSLIVALTGVAFSIPAVTAVAGDAPLHMTHEWHVSLDAGGKVAALKDTGELAAGVRDPLERAIRGWSFEPGRIDGKPAPTETALTLEVTFVPAADGNYSVRIDDARTGGTIDTRDSKAAPPRFPHELARRTPFLGRVVVRADYDAEGRIVTVTAQPDQGIHATRSLDAATIAAVRQWKAIPERVDGHGVAASVMVPVCYTAVLAGSRPPDYNCTWTPPGSNSKVDNGGSFALAPTAKLVSDVIGHAL
ncbi:MAG: energy transducer TonB [Dokdonella sp.]